MRRDRRAPAFLAIAPIAMLLTIAVAGCGGVPSNLRFEDLGPCRVAVTTSPDPPTTGENEMTLVVHDTEDRPLRGVAVDVVVWMPAMGSMPYMESRGKVRETRPGVYRARYGLSMAGDWEVSVKLRPREGPPASGGWRLSTNAPGVAFTGASTRLAPAPNVGEGGPRGHAPAPPGDGASEVVIDAERRQSLGIKVEPVGPRDLIADLRASGRVAYDESRRTDVSPRFSGWVRTIRADFTGQPVRRGDVLFEIYSPELWATEQEFLEALAAARQDSARGGGSGNAELARAARQRLMLAGLAETDVEALERTGRRRETVPVRAPESGVITEKNVTLGSPVTAGQVAYRLAPTDPVWVLASLAEQDLPVVRVGSVVRLTAAGLPGRERVGRVSFIAPELDPESRTATVRVSVPNGDGRLKPGMFVDVRINVALGRRLAIPQTAVLPTGERKIVFVDLGDGRLSAREVTLGTRAGDWVEVLGGLAAGDRVVTSGNFLVAAESRVRSAAGKW